MNWPALLQFILNYFEKNPQLAESLITALLNLFTNNPALLTSAVTTGLAHAQAAVPKPVA